MRNRPPALGIGLKMPGNRPWRAQIIPKSCKNRVRQCQRGTKSVKNRPLALHIGLKRLVNKALKGSNCYKIIQWSNLMLMWAHLPVSSLCHRPYIRYEIRCLWKCWFFLWFILMAKRSKTGLQPSVLASKVLGISPKWCRNRENLVK